MKRQIMSLGAIILIHGCGSRDKTGSSLDSYVGKGGVIRAEIMTLNDPVKEHDISRMCDDAKCEKYKNTGEIWVYPNANAGCVFSTPKKTIKSGKLLTGAVTFDIESASPGVTRVWHPAAGGKLRVKGKELIDMNFSVQLLYKNANDRNAKAIVRDERHLKASLGFGDTRIRKTFGEREIRFSAEERYPLGDVQIRICVDHGGEINAIKGDGLEIGFHAPTWPNDDRYPNVENVMDMHPGKRVIRNSNQLFVFSVTRAVLEYTQK